VKALPFAALAATLVAIASSLHAADEAYRPDWLARLTAELEAEDKPTGLPPLDVVTGTFIELPPTGFTTEEYRAAFKQLVLDDVDRRCRDANFQGLDQNRVRQLLLEHMQNNAEPGDLVTEVAIEALWYLRTPPADIPPSPAAPVPTPEIASLRITQSLFSFYSWALVIAVCLITDRHRRAGVI